MDHNTRGERLQIMLSPEELRLVDDFRFRYRMPSRAAAVRELLNRGLKTPEIIGELGQRRMKSSEYGVSDFPLNGDSEK